jgi:pimeloyl-ACP methyl ester carboxylesterase
MRQRPQAIAALVLIGLLLPVSGCGTTPKQPDLKRLYVVSASQRFQNPVVLIPGSLASRLRTTADKQEIWPGPLTNFIVDRSETIALEIDGETLEPAKGQVEPYALMDGYAGRHYYSQIQEALEHAGGYALGDLREQNSKVDRRYYLFLYDWRQDVVETAAELDRFIEQIRRNYGDPNLKVDIVAHSMGGLIARYYLRYGGEDVLDADVFRLSHAGAGKVRKVVLIGTPNWGSISGLQMFMGGYRLGLVKFQPELLATMPAAYELLPHPDRDWMITSKGDKWERDLYDVDTWRIYQWSIFDPKARARVRKRFASDEDAQRYLATLERYFAKNLQRARRFYRALSVPLGESPVRYIVFGGDCTLTPARCLVERVNGQLRIRFHPSEVVNRVPGVDYDRLMLEPGDGRVTKASLLARNSLDPSVETHAGDFPLAYSVFLCEGHRLLTANLTFQDNLLNILLTQESNEDRMRSSGAPTTK